MVSIYCIHPPKFNSSLLKNGDWKTICLLGFWGVLPQGRAVKNFGRASGWQKYMAGTVEWSLLRYYLLTKKVQLLHRPACDFFPLTVFRHPSKTFRQPLSYGSTCLNVIMLPKLMYPHFECITHLQNPSPWKKTSFLRTFVFSNLSKKNTPKKTTRLKTNPFTFPPTKNKYTPKKLTWNLKMMVWKMVFPFQGWKILRFQPLIVLGVSPPKKKHPMPQVARTCLCHSFRDPPHPRVCSHRTRSNHRAQPIATILQQVPVESAKWSQSLTWFTWKWHPWNRRFRLWQQDFEVPMFNLGRVSGKLGVYRPGGLGLIYP